MEKDRWKSLRLLAARAGQSLLVIALALLCVASTLDLLQMLEPSQHYYFYASRWMGTGLALALLACAGFWLSPKYDPLAGDESDGHPGLRTMLLLAFYAASWAIRKHQDRHLTDLAALLSFTGWAGLVALVWTTFRQRTLVGRG